MLLMRGSQGADVAALQYQLNAAANVPLQYTRFPPLVVDGVFGGATQARVVEFQNINRLTADGIVGPATQGALDALVGPAQTWRPSGGAGPGGVFPKIADKDRLAVFPKVEGIFPKIESTSGPIKLGGLFPKTSSAGKW